MPLTTDTCSTLVGQCVSVLFRVDQCLNPEEQAAPPTLVGTLVRKGQKICDPNGAFLTPGAVAASGQAISPIQTYTNDDWSTVAINGCDYYKLDTCPIPATLDSAPPEDGSIRHLAGACYELTLKVNGSTCGPWKIQIDAGADYTAIEDGDGCLPVKSLLDIVNPDVSLPTFTDAVCATACITDIQSQIDDLTTQLEELVCTPEKMQAIATAFAA